MAKQSFAISVDERVNEIENEDVQEIVFAILFTAQLYGGLHYDHMRTEIKDTFPEYSDEVIDQVCDTLIKFGYVKPDQSMKGGKNG